MLLRPALHAILVVKTTIKCMLACSVVDVNTPTPRHSSGYVLCSRARLLCSCHHPELCSRALRCYCSRGIAWPCTPTVCSARSCPGCSHNGSSSLVLRTTLWAVACQPWARRARECLCTRHILRYTPLALCCARYPCPHATPARHTHTHTHTHTRAHPRACCVLPRPPWRKIKRPRQRRNQKKTNPSLPRPGPVVLALPSAAPSPRPKAKDRQHRGR